MSVTLPCADTTRWTHVCDILRSWLSSGVTRVSDLDTIINTLTPKDATCLPCKFFHTTFNAGEGSDQFMSCFDLGGFLIFGVPFMLRVALEAPTLFPTSTLPLLAQGGSYASVELSRRQCACLLALSALGVFQGRSEGKERYRFRVHQLFCMNATPSALCFMNYFRVVARDEKLLEGSVTYVRRKMAEGDDVPLAHSKQPLCPVAFISEPAQRIECDTTAELHVDFSNMQIGGGVLTGDFGQEEILFCAKPELAVAIAFTTLLRDEEVLVIDGARMYSTVSGLRSEFRFEGDVMTQLTSPPPRVVALDALDLRVGLKPRQFEIPFVRRDIRKAWLGLQGCSGSVLATGHWGCGSFGHDHFLKFLQQWLAASAAGGITEIRYYTMGDTKGEGVERLLEKFQFLSVGDLWTKVEIACAGIPPSLQAPKVFREKIMLC